LGRAGRELEAEAWPGSGFSLVDELLRPSLIYTPAVLALLSRFSVRAVAHITGGGIPANLPRALPPDLDAMVQLGSWPVPPIFGLVQEAAAVDDDEMARTFNMGLGMVVVLPADQVGPALEVVSRLGFGASPVGRLVAGSGRCVLRPALG
jgi:phosphoribosylformylglycinamidine cyclo-ligase